MEFIVKYWYLIVIGIVVVIDVAHNVVRFGSMTTEQKVEKIKGWLLQAVMMAEKEYGSGTGALKLSVVYARFCEQLPWLAQVITFETFSGYVDEALARMRQLLISNQNIAAVIEGEENAG